MTVDLVFSVAIAIEPLLFSLLVSLHLSFNYILSCKIWTLKFDRVSPRTPHCLTLPPLCI